MENILANIGKFYWQIYGKISGKFYWQISHRDTQNKQ